MSSKPGVYVETVIHGDVEEVWRRTQVPELHQLWDLRFTSIQYLPKNSEAEPQKFLYSTRIGFGLKIAGEGESTGKREDLTGERTSALKFWSDDPKSLIKEGSGYWRYIPEHGGVRFLTWYDYHTRFGASGRLMDRIFRPLIGWATAWSFDRLRLWIERGIAPATSLRMSLIHALARFSIVFAWVWQGLMPKLLFPSADERSMLLAASLPLTILPLLGVTELCFAVLGLVAWRWRPYFLLNMAAMIASLVVVGLRAPFYLIAAFNPVTLNALVIAMSFVGYISGTELPSASRCARKPAEKL
ncbi:MAG TPA: DoxX-like family protein [Candidatus Angelobacter sp.]|nr:DoxX-like family protein [Candidatus Angelobacter sp.]